MLFIYKNRGATVGDIICASPAPGLTLNSYDDFIDCIVSKYARCQQAADCTMDLYIPICAEITLLTYDVKRVM